MTRDRSSPVTVRVALAASAPGPISWLVITPSTSTCGVPLMVATMTTRTSGIGLPPESRKRVCSGDEVFNVNCNWKTLGRSSLVVTVTEVSASSTSRGTGIGTTGPIIRVRWMPLSIGRSRDALRQGDAQPAARGLGQFLGTHRAIGVADAPKELWIAQVVRGDLVQSLTRGDGVLLEQCEALRGRHDAAAQVGD